MMMKILQVLTYITIFQSFLLILNLIIKKGNRFTRNILISFLIVFGIFLSGNLLIFTSGMKYYKIYHILNLVIFLVAPLLYLFFSATLNKKSRLVKKDIIHFLPFIFISLLFASIIIGSSGRRFSFNNYGTIIMGILFMQNVFYLVTILTELKKSKAKSILSDRDYYDYGATVSSVNQELTWMHKSFLLILIILSLKAVFFFSCRLFSIVQICALFTGIVFIISFFLINNIIILGLYKSTIFDDRNKYQKKAIKDELRAEYIKKIEHALIKDKVYLDPLLTIEKLSKNIKIPRNNLSQVINENFALNFNEFINQLRINDAKNMISEGKDIPIIEIAYSVGFNSKSTFNTAFKRFTGKTPSHFMAG